MTVKKRLGKIPLENKINKENDRIDDDDLLKGFFYWKQRFCEFSKSCTERILKKEKNTFSEYLH